MAFTGALYEGDSVIHTMPVISGIQARLKGGVATAHPAREVSALENAELGRAQLRAWSYLIKAIFGGIKSLAEWIDRKSRDAHYRQIEGYLSQATDHAVEQILPGEGVARPLDEQHRHGDEGEVAVAELVRPPRGVERVAEEAEAAGTRTARHHL